MLEVKNSVLHGQGNLEIFVIFTRNTEVERVDMDCLLKVALHGAS